MGIGRASGDNRATQAAQQAIESPLIEVSIDGAKGVLFNVTGGYDMSMSEIQEAADIITSAVAPDANIIFGATLKPEMEDELIITVIATGFDSQYFHDQVAAFADEAAGEEKAAEISPEMNDTAVTEAVSSIDMDLNPSTDTTNHFAADDDNPTSIWNEVNEDASDMPAFLRRKKKKKEDK